jgi:hypothetical protein
MIKINNFSTTLLVSSRLMDLIIITSEFPLYPAISKCHISDAMQATQLEVNLRLVYVTKRCFTAIRRIQVGEPTKRR